MIPSHQRHLNEFKMDWRKKLKQLPIKDFTTLKEGDMIKYINVSGGTRYGKFINMEGNDLWAIWGDEINSTTDRGFIDTTDYTNPLYRVH